MASDRKQKQSNSIPIRFFDGDDPRASADNAELEERAERPDSEANSKADPADPEFNDTDLGGPDLAELVASRAELKRLQTALDEAREGIASESNVNAAKPTSASLVTSHVSCCR